MTDMVVEEMTTTGVIEVNIVENVARSRIHKYVPKHRLIMSMAGRLAA